MIESILGYLSLRPDRGVKGQWLWPVYTGMEDVSLLVFKRRNMVLTMEEFLV